MDPVFDLQPPIVFAHRGGAAEKPESTEEAFRWAITHRSDVLELDIQLTCDGEIVVWHGPELNNVHDGACAFGETVRIWDQSWEEDLAGRAWVLHPDEAGKLLAVRERLLLSLEGFVGLLSDLDTEVGGPTPLNIELKVSGGEAPGWDGSDRSGQAIWDKLFGILDPEVSRRRIVLASADPVLLKELRKQATRPDGFRYPTNLSWKEQLAYSRHMPWLVRMAGAVGGWFIGVPSRPDTLRNVAFETSWKLVTKDLVDAVHAEGGGVYAFLTGFSRLLPAIDNKEVKELKGELRALLATGVDGVMTDYPAKVRALL